MWKQFTIQGNRKWINILDDLVNSYNNTKNKTIKIKPTEVNEENGRDLLEKASSKAYIIHIINKISLCRNLNIKLVINLELVKQRKRLKKDVLLIGLKKFLLCLGLY